MPLKDDDPGEQMTIVKRWEGGLTWMAHPDAQMQRASQALVVGGEVWLVDPLDADGLDEELASLGTVAGVVVLSSQHDRHADRLAESHDVSIHVPEWFDDPATDFDAQVEPFNEHLDGTGFELIRLPDRQWQEGALFDPERKTLVVSDSLMTALVTGEDGRLELFPPARLSPPKRELGDLDVERVLVGHGKPVFDDAQLALQQALAEEHRGTASAFLRNVPTFARIAYSAIRG